MNEIPPFDIHAPMDAPIRAQEAREQAEREAWQRALEDPEVQAKIRKICLDAMKEVRRKGPRTGPPR
jgi:hypothetical protein